jgi:PAS domain S-box-containing protein
MIDQERADILMVDDQVGKLMSYEAILGPLGENLIKARSAREALEHLLHHDVAVVLMDVSMPEIDGFELADMMRQHPRFQKTAIIFISAVHLTDLDRIKGYRSGAVDYISVPVIPELLRAKVGVFSELHRKTRQLERLNADLEKRVQDRTEQLRKSEEQLHERVAELEAIMQVLPVGVAVSQDTEGHLVTANAAFDNLLGPTPGEALSTDLRASQSASFAIYEKGRRLANEEHPLVRAARTGQQVGSLELEIRRPQKESAYLLASASPLFDYEGKARGAVGAFIDVTDRKQLEDLLRERADLLELATEAIMVRDLDGILRYWNAGAEALYGWQRDEVIGKSIHELLQTRFPTGFLTVQAELTRTGSWTGNLTQFTREGHEVIVACRKALKAGGNAILEINRDITAQLKAEDALRKTERLAAMGRVAGIIAHEINNPLEAITNTFYLLRDHPSLDEEARYYAELGEKELHRVAHITRQTLGFYRESKHPVEVSISELLDEILELQTRRMEFNKIVLDKRYQSRGSIYGFPVELKQVFLNLIGNAVQAMPDGGPLRLHVFESSHRLDQCAGVCISICDTGTGIDAEDAKHLFEPFFTTKSTKGTGLGLWISKGIIQKYGGSIRFRSMSLAGRNVTCFQVFLPEADFEKHEEPSVVASEKVRVPTAAGVSNGH